jgi:hypothetical protein
VKSGGGGSSNGEKNGENGGVKVANGHQHAEMREVAGSQRKAKISANLNYQRNILNGGASCKKSWRRRRNLAAA